MTLSESNIYFQNPQPKQMELVFSETGEEDIVLTNEHIVSEEMSLEESICSEENLMFGTCEASCFKVRVVNNAEFKGRTLVVTQKIKSAYQRIADSDGNDIVDDKGSFLVASNNSDDYTEIPYGTFKVFSDKPSNDRMWRDLVCYDVMYEVLNAEVSSWYSGLTFPMTLKNLRDSFFTYLGITQETQTLINDDYVTKGGFTAEGSLSGKTIIEAICELNACFGHINRDGKFEYITLPSSNSVTLGWYIDGTGKFEDYTTDVITGVTARSEANDVGTSVGTDVNRLIIENNPLIFGDEGEQTLIDALDNILDAVETISYRPFSIDTYGNPCLPIGTNITYTTKVYDPENGYEDLQITTIVKSRTLKGIQGLVDSYSATGTQQRPSEANSLRSELLRTAGKVHKVTVDLDTFESEVSDAFEQSYSLIQQNSDSIKLEVNRVDEAFAYPCKTSTISDFSLRFRDATTFLTQEEFDNVIISVFDREMLSASHYMPDSEMNNNYMFMYRAQVNAFNLIEYNNSTWTVIKSQGAGSSYKTANGLIIDLTNNSLFKNFIPELNYGFTIEVELSAVWVASSDNEYFVSLRFDKFDDDTGQNNREMIYPIYDNGEVLNPSNYSVGDKLCIKLVPWSEISNGMNPYGFKYVFNIIDKNYDKYVSKIDMLGKQIVLTVNNSNRIVTAELGIDPSSSTSYFQVNADNINLSANDVFNIMSGNTLNIEAKNIAITTTSGKFSVTAAGALTCTSGKIADWNIDANSLYKLTGTEGHDTNYSKTILKPSEIDFYENDPFYFGEMRTQLCAQGFFHYAYNGSSWIKDFAIDFHQLGLQSPDVIRISALTGTIDTWGDTGCISLNDAIGSLVKSGSKVINTTNSTKQIIFTNEQVNSILGVSDSTFSNTVIYACNGDYVRTQNIISVYYDGTSSQTNKGWYAQFDTAPTSGASYRVNYIITYFG